MLRLLDIVVEGVVDRLLQRRLIYKGYDPKFHSNAEFIVTKL
jgi:hypothetical protein